MYEICAPEHDAGSLAGVHHEYQKDRSYLATPFPKVLETLSAIRHAGIKTAAVTTRYKSSLYATLEHSNMMKLFDAIVTGDDVKNPKPHPEPLVRALQSLQVDAKDAYMVGDTVNDIEAGKHTGMKTIAVSYGFQGVGVLTQNLTIWWLQLKTFCLLFFLSSRLGIYLVLPIRSFLHDAKMLSVQQEHSLSFPATP